MSRVPLRLALVALLPGLPVAAVSAAAAERPGVLTLLDGEATLLIGNRAVAAAPGLRLPAGTLVQTGGQTRLLRVEWADGSRADLGPDTRAELRPPGAARALLYLLRGFAKQTQDAPTAGLVAPTFELKPFKGVVVAEVADAGTVLFAESSTGGALAATARRGGEALVLKAGQAAVASDDGALKVQPRPPAGWAAHIPRAFRDTVPSQLARYKGPAPAPKALPQPDYAWIQPWLAAEPMLRRELPQRLSAWLADHAFRDAVIGHLAQHPEWEPLVRPPRPPARRLSDTPASAPEAPR